MKENDEDISISPRRWPIISIFALYSLSSAFQWISFAIIPGIFQTYYDVSPSAITWTSMIYMATFIPLVFPATWMIDNTGMKNVALLGSGLNALGTLIKCFAIHPDMFWLAFVGQTVAACAQCLILELPPKIASLWFPSKEVSTATSFGVFGNQLGVALGFLIPPLIVTGPLLAFNGVKNQNETFSGNFPDNWRDTNEWGAEIVDSATDEVTLQLKYFFYGFSLFCFILFLLVLFLFKDKPDKPANRASVRRSTTKTESIALESSGNGSSVFLTSIKEYSFSIVRLCKSVPFLLLVVSYGLNVGVYYALSTLLNQLIKPTFLDNDSYPNEFLASLDAKIGQMGTVMVLAGLAGSIIGGLILDSFKRFKLTSLLTYVCTLVFMVLFTFMVDKESLKVDYIFIGVLGFFMTGYLPIGFEFGAELTYPESEATSSGLLNCSAQIFGLIVTQLCQSIIEYFSTSNEDGTDDIAGKIQGGFYANLAMIVCLIVGLILTGLIKEDLRRQAVENEGLLDNGNNQKNPENHETTNLIA